MQGGASSVRNAWSGSAGRIPLKAVLEREYSFTS